MMASHKTVADASSSTCCDALERTYRPHMPAQLRLYPHYSPVHGDSLRYWVTGPNDSQSHVASNAICETKELLRIFQKELRSLEDLRRPRVCDVLLADRCLMNVSAQTDYTDGNDSCEEVELSLAVAKSLLALEETSDKQQLRKHLWKLQTLKHPVSNSSTSPSSSVSSPDSPLASRIPQTTSAQQPTFPDAPVFQHELHPQTTKDEVNTTHKTSSKDLEEEMQALEEGNLCKTCLQNDIDVVLLPCGHFVICSACLLKIERCPVCRAVVRVSVRAKIPE